MNLIQFHPMISSPCSSLFCSYFAFSTPLKLWLLVGGSLGLPKVVDFGHPCPMTSLFFTLLPKITSAEKQGEWGRSSREYYIFDGNKQRHRTKGSRSPHLPKSGGFPFVQRKENVMWKGIKFIFSVLPARVLNSCFDTYRSLDCRMMEMQKSQKEYFF